MFNLNDVWPQKLIIIIIILTATVLTAWLTSRLFNTIIKRLTKRSRNKLDDVLLHALKGPLIYAIVLVGVWLALQSADFIIDPNNQIAANTFFVALLILVYVAIFRLIIGVTAWYRRDIAHQTSTELDEQILPLFRRILLIVVSAIAVIILLGRFDIDVSALVATLGVTSLAVALAAQAVLEDMISGFIINVDRPFRIGDRIELEELNTWGDVKDIGLRSTRILTRDHRLVSIPNSVLGRSRIVNHSIPSTQYRVQTHVSVAYGVDIDHARQVMIDAVAAQGWVMKNKPVEALFLEFQDSGLMFRVRCWIEHYVETRRIIDKLNTTIYKALNDADIEIPFPQRVVHLQSHQE